MPLILKLNGKTDIPSDARRSRRCTRVSPTRSGWGRCGGVHALRRHTGRRRQDFAQLRQVRADAQRFGMPLVVWAYPRGAAIDAKGGKDSFYAVDYAARTASELGADVVKVNFPHPDKRADVPAAYDADFSSQQAVDAVVRSANRTLVLISVERRPVTTRCWRRPASPWRRVRPGSSSGATSGSATTTSRCGSSPRLRDILAKYPSA